MGPFRLTNQEARTLTVLLIILVAGMLGMLIWGGDSEPEDNMAAHEEASAP